jgi:hypothetical protein
MIKQVIISILILCTTIGINAQHASIKLWADQKVFMAGEDMWVDGMIQHTKESSKSIQIQLLDRNGNKKAEAEVWMNGNSFNAFMTVPENLPSDYYFLDAYMKGIHTSTALFPVMVINPKLSPSLGCSFNGTSNANNLSPIVIFPDKETYKPREEVKLTLTGIANTNETHVSVVRNDVLNTQYESAADGFNTLVDHNEGYDKNDEGNIVIAKISKGGKPISGISVLASLKGSASRLSIATSDEIGIVKFLFPYIFDATGIVLRAMSNEKDFNLEIITRQTIQPIAFPCLKLDESSTSDIEARMLNVNVTKHFHADMNRLVKNNIADTIDFYGKPDARYNLDDYVRFPDMEEVFAEIVTEARVKKEKENSMLQALNIPFKFFFTNEALILVDGIPYFNTKELLESDPLLIKSIEVISRKYILGDKEFDGIVHFKTYKHDMGSLRLSDADKFFPLKGIQKNTLLRPSFEIDNKTKMPDFRNIVYKKDGIQSDFRGTANIQFMLSDAIGTYSIIARVVDKQGNSVISSKTIQITN